MRTLVLPCALVLALSVGGPVQAQAPAPGVAGLQTELDATVARAAVLADALEQAAARDGGLRAELEDLAAQSDAAQVRLDARVRQVFMRGGPDPLASLVVRLGAPAVTRARQAGLSASVRAERDLVDAVAQQSGRVRRLQARAAAFRASLQRQAAAVLVEQERARALVREAEEALRDQQQAAETAAAQAVARAAVRDRQQELDRSAALLDAVSAAVTRSLTPAQTARGRRAQEREAPLLALAEAAGSGYPAGHGPSGRVVRGTASWYGPGFVGSPTASGAPYDPERLGCAHKSLPLGTLLRVSRGPLAVTCLVNDRGPYVGDRVLDLSRAGSRALGYDGTAEVVAEVLERR